MWTLIAIFVVVFILILFIAAKADASETDQNIKRDLALKQKEVYTPSPSQNMKSFQKVDHSDQGGTYFPIKVVGTKFRDDSEKKRVLSLVENEPVKLVREEDNKMDMNAIKVMTEDNVHIGYVPAEYASKMVDDFSSLVDCHVVKVEGEYNPTIIILPFFSIVNKFYYTWLINNPKEASDYFDTKYDGFKEMSYMRDFDDDDYINYILSLIEENPKDSFLRYLAAEYYLDNEKFEEASKITDYLINVERLFKIDEIVILSYYANKGVELTKDKTMKSTLKEWYDEGRSFMEDEEYFDALEKFLDCFYLGMKNQSLIRKICKCYQETEQWRKLHRFIDKALTKSWISSTTEDFLINKF